MDLSFLRPLYARPGPFACAYLDATGHQDGHGTSPAGWGRLRERLVAEGADLATVGALTHAMTPGDDGVSSPGLAVFAAHGRLALAEPLPERPEHDRTAVTFVPDAMPLALQHAPDIPFAVVQIRRAPEDRSHLVAETQIGRWPWARIVPPEPRIRQVVDGEWHRSAAALAAELAAVAERHGTELVLLSGDLWGCSVLREALPEWLDGRVAALDCGLQEAESGRLLFEQELCFLLLGRLNAADQRQVDRFPAERARHGDAVEGLEATTRALRERRVATLFVDIPTVLDHEQLWVGAATGQVGMSQEALAPLAPDACWQAPADAAVLRALVGEGGDLVAVPREELPLTDGVGALLRERPPARAV